MAMSEYEEVHHDSNACLSTPLEKKPTEVELPETLRWRRWRSFIVSTFITCIISIPAARGDLVEKPLNAAVMMGSDPVEFKCKSDHGYNLKWFTHQNQSKPILFNGYSVSKESQSFCSVENKAPGEFSLKLTAIREAAQTYICQEPGEINEPSADLIIIEREAQCKTNANNSDVIITCDLEFRGNWPPELEWSYNGTLITEGVNASIVSNKTVSSTLTVPISAIDRKYTCTTRFDIRGKPHWTSSSNVPDYVSHSEQTANQAIAEKQEGPFSASGMSMGWVIGITAVAVIVFAAIVTSVIYWRKRKKGRRNEDAAADVSELLAA